MKEPILKDCTVLLEKLVTESSKNSSIQSNTDVSHRGGAANSAEFLPVINVEDSVQDLEEDGTIQIIVSNNEIEEPTETHIGQQFGCEENAQDMSHYLSADILTVEKEDGTAGVLFKKTSKRLRYGATTSSTNDTHYLVVGRCTTRVKECNSVIKDCEFPTVDVGKVKECNSVTKDCEFPTVDVESSKNSSIQSDTDVSHRDGAANSAEFLPVINVEDSVPDLEEEDGTIQILCFTKDKTEESNETFIKQRPGYREEPQHVSRKHAVTSEPVRQESERQKSTRKKTHRPCPYCFCFKSALTRHITTKHCNEIEVKDALSLPKQDRSRAFQLMKRKGIMAKNMSTLHSNTGAADALIRERKVKHINNKELIYCSKCFGFFATTYFHRHRRSCHLNERSVYFPHAVQPNAVTYETNENEMFTTEILGPMFSDDVGILCKTDTIIVSFAKKKFKKLLSKQNSDDKKTQIRSEMRRLGHLYKEFKALSDMIGTACLSSVEMFKAEHFYILEDALEQVTTREDGSVKNGLKKDLGYLLKRVCKFLHGKFSVEGQTEKRNQIDNFLEVLTFNWVDVFGEAESALVCKSQTTLRKPFNLPRKSEVKQLRDYTIKQLQKMTEIIQSEVSVKSNGQINRRSQFVDKATSCIDGSTVD